MNILAENRSTKLINDYFKNLTQNDRNELLELLSSGPASSWSKLFSENKK